ncbi:TrkH family potassium uptake protein [Thiomicrospira sp. R3]|uniref:TrkH family potassium uptake protein n=1 Tax=Thiomicrospira sp. R3 TaxID=3035472 RepID=UPI00259BE540|nr:TrkH family potassium uptake protein [Thiomicrospira sp. R3]WFE69325.1 TrkH family potassium uptake protein [Thiomicrospira sp. R3]
MQAKMIIKILGLLLMLYSLSLVPPITIGLIYQDGAVMAFVTAMLLTLIAGSLLWYPNRHHKRDLKIRDGFIVVVMFWTALGLVGALPFVLEEEVPISITDAIFESFSGLTTTGATVLSGLDDMPHAILWYRQQLQWLGGMGIIVLAVAILPMLGIGGMQLYRAEMPGPSKDNKLAPRISETAKTLWMIYLSLTIVCAMAYWMAGMSWFDAIGHSFSTVAIGGFSTHDASIGYFDSAVIEAIAIFFMFLAGANFALHFRAFRSLKAKPYFFDPEFRTYTLVLLVGVAISTLYLYSQQVYDTLLESLRYGAFMTVSISTTTGFGNADFAMWPGFLPVMLIFMSFIGGSAGSTGGGIKVIRFLLLLKQGAREIQRLMHPNALMPVKLNGRTISERVMSSVWGFFALYVATFAVILLALMMLGMDQVTAFSATAATLNNLGPGLGDVAANFGGLNDPQKWILTLSMLLGRLEIFTLLVILTRTFWRA